MTMKMVVAVKMTIVGDGDDNGKHIGTVIEVKR